MKKVFLTMTMIFVTMIASAQISALTTLNVEDEADGKTYNVTDNIGVGYQINESLMVGVTRNGEENYNFLGRYSLNNGIWATCIYNYAPDSEDELMDRLNVGVGYSIKVWRGLHVDPNYTMPLKEDEGGNREGSFNIGFSYKL